MRGGGVLQVLWMSSLVFATHNARARNPLSWSDGHLATMVHSRIYKDCLACLFTVEYVNCPNCLALSKTAAVLPAETKRAADLDNAVNPPLDCATGEAPYTDLGSKYFPRYVRQVKCDALHCGYCTSPFQCHTITYPVSFLVKRTVGDTSDGNIPPALQSDWKFESLDLGVGCNCTA